MGRTIAVECSDHWGGQVDLDPSDGPQTAAAKLLRQMLTSEGEDQVAFRSGERRVLRLARWQPPSERHARTPIRADATYLVTGGLGGIGLQIAWWLVERGARHLVLASRNALPSPDDEGPLDTRHLAVRALEEMGARVQVVQADMGNEASVRGLIDHCAAPDHPSLRGVFHAAGVMQYELLTSLTPERLRAVLSAKVAGGWFLHRLLAGSPLDYFVLFSSSSSLLSSPMMAGYAAANVFLDTLAHHRRAMGLPALSINWGTWAETGMATRFMAEGRFDRQGRRGTVRGVGSLTTKRALEAFDRLLGTSAAQVGVVPIDWEEWQRSYDALAASPYLSLLITGTPPARDEGQGARDRFQADGFLALEPEARLNALRDYLARRISCILKVPLSSVDAETPISQFGFDSLMSIELKNSVESDLQLAIPMARLLEGPPVMTLAQWLREQLESSEGTAAASRRGRRDEPWVEGEI